MTGLITLGYARKDYVSKYVNVYTFYAGFHRKMEQKRPENKMILSE